MKNEILFIVMPAYNEGENIENTIKEWHPIVQKVGLSSKLIIFNDGSKDNTFDIMQGLQNKYSQFVPVTKSNSGHGSTVLFAYNYAIEAGADFIFQTDSDGQTNPDEFWEFWNRRNDSDFVIGYRNKRQDGFSRIVVTRTLRLIVRLIFGEFVKDPNTPFRLMNTKRLKPILELIPSDFFLSNVIISMLAVKKKEKVTWLPISFRPRQGGINSIQIKRIIKIGFLAISDFNVIKNNIKTSGI
jgi:dolichol-phosphate mannosyltransferase